MLNRIKRIILAFQIRAADIEIDDKTEAIEAVGDPFLEVFIYNRREQAKAERVRLRAAYNATLPIGERRTWASA